MDEPFQRVDVLAVGAHPDDVEIACGGTLAKLAAQGYRVGIVDLTDGEPTPRSPGPEVRLAEARRAAETLGAVVRVTLDLPNRRLMDGFEARVALAKEFRKYRPRLVIGLGAGTTAGVARPRPGRHDYGSGGLLQPADEVGRALRGLARPYRAGLSLLFPGLSATRAGRARRRGRRYWRRAGEEDGGHCLLPDASFRRRRAHHLEGIRAYALQQGMAAGFAAGEVLASPGTWGTRDLMGLLFRKKAEGGRERRGKAGRGCETASVAGRAISSFTP